jgi:hypothetical protein
VKGPTVSDILAGRAGPYFRADHAPDGRSAIVVASYEMRMSHWIERAALYALPEQRLLAQIGETLWSADKIAWTSSGRGVSIDLRRYPGDIPGVTVAIDLDQGVAQFGANPSLPLAELSAALEADYHARGGRG